MNAWPNPSTSTSAPGVRTDRSCSAVCPAGTYASPCSARTRRARRHCVGRVEVAEGEHDDVGGQLTAVVEDDRLAVAGVEDVDGHGRVLTTSTGARKAGDDLFVEPVQVHRLHTPPRSWRLIEKGVGRKTMKNNARL